MTHAELLRIYWAANPDLLVSGRLVKEEPVSAVSKRGLCWFFSSNGYLHRADTIKPHLKPLSSITDEDAIEIAKIIDSLEDNWAIESRDEHVVLVVSSYTKVWVWFDTEINAEELNHTGSHEEWQTYSISHCYSELTDYLRSKSYNLDFKEGEFIPIAETLFPEKLKQAEELVAKYPIPDRLD